LLTLGFLDEPFVKIGSNFPLVGTILLTFCF
jgi:hypothetical protein